MKELDNLKAQLKKTFNDSMQAKNWVTETKQATVKFVSKRLNQNSHDKEYVWMASELNEPLSTQGLPDKTETAIKDCVSLLACAYKDVLLSYFPRKSIISRVKDALFYIIRHNWYDAVFHHTNIHLRQPGAMYKICEPESNELKQFTIKLKKLLDKMKTDPGNLKKSLNQIKKPSNPTQTGKSLNEAMTDWWNKMSDAWLAKVGKLDKNHINFQWDDCLDAAYWAMTAPTTVGWAIRDDFV